jgi:hypothetical protein
MKSSTAILSALAVAGMLTASAASVTAQVPVYQTTVTYTTTQPVAIPNARIVPPPPAFVSAPMVVRQPIVYVAPPPAPVYVRPPVYFAPPIINIGFGYGGCRSAFGWGVGFGFGGGYGPRYCW